MTAEDEILATVRDSLEYIYNLNREAGERFDNVERQVRENYDNMERQARERHDDMERQARERHDDMQQRTDGRLDVVIDMLQNALADIQESHRRLPTIYAILTLFDHFVNILWTVCFGPFRWFFLFLRRMTGM